MHASFLYLHFTHSRKNCRCWSVLASKLRRKQTWKIKCKQNYACKVYERANMHACVSSCLWSYVHWDMDSGKSSKVEKWSKTKTNGKSTKCKGLEYGTKCDNIKMYGAKIAKNRNNILSSLLFIALSFPHTLDDEKLEGKKRRWCVYKWSRISSCNQWVDYICEIHWIIYFSRSSSDFNTLWYIISIWILC